MQVKNKKEYYKLFEKGFLGNKAKNWNSIKEINESGFEGLITIRSKKGIARRFVKYYVPIKVLQHEIQSLLRDGAKESEIYFNEGMPDDKLLIQGEIMRTDNGFHLHYTKRKLPMNIALEEESEQVCGLPALNILMLNMNCQSIEDLQELFDIFPDSVIEFSTYSVNVGNMRGRNTIIWEVRDY